MTGHPELQSPALMALRDDVEIHSNGAEWLEMACRVLQIVPEYLASTPSILGASRAIFPVKCAFLQFRDSEVERRHCCTLLAQLSSNKGLRFSAIIDTSVIPGVIREELMHYNTEMLEH